MSQRLHNSKAGPPPLGTGRGPSSFADQECAAVLRNESAPSRGHETAAGPPSVLAGRSFDGYPPQGGRYSSRDLMGWNLPRRRVRRHEIQPSPMTTERASARRMSRLARPGPPAAPRSSHDPTEIGRPGEYQADSGEACENPEDELTVQPLGARPRSGNGRRWPAPGASLPERRPAEAGDAPPTANRPTPRLGVVRARSPSP
jgi:hypothetical protein